MNYKQINIEDLKDKGTENDEQECFEVDTTLTALRLLKALGRKGILSDSVRAKLVLYERKLLQKEEDL